MVALALNPDSRTNVSVDGATTAEPEWRISVTDPSSFSTAGMSALHHNYNLHPLMQLPALSELAQELYQSGQCRFIRPGSTQASEFWHDGQAHDGKSIGEVFRRIEEPGSWIALYNIETNPRYRDLLNEITSKVRALVDPQEPGMSDVGGFIFISAPPSVTPFHIDREHNFWLQIRGRKCLTVWDHKDREVVAQPDVENFIVYGGLENVKLRAGMLERGTEFDSGPGDGLYFPSTSPHATRSDPAWTKPGDGVSISVGVVFYTDHTRRLANIHAGNMFLRKLGLKPAYPGPSDAFSTVRYWFGRSVVGAKTSFGRLTPKKGF